MLKISKNLIKYKRKGQDAPEWGVAVAMVAIIAMVALMAFAPLLRDMVTNISAALNYQSQ